MTTPKTSTHVLFASTMFFASIALTPQSVLAMGGGRTSGTVMGITPSQTLSSPEQQEVAFLCEANEYDFYYRNANPSVRNEHHLIMRNKATGTTQYLNYAHSVSASSTSFSFQMFGGYSHLTTPFGGHNPRQALAFSSDNHRQVIQNIVNRFNAMDVNSVSGEMTWRHRDHSVRTTLTVVQGRGYLEYPVTCISVPVAQVPAVFTTMEREFVSQYNLLVELNTIQDIGGLNCSRQAAARRSQLMSSIALGSPRRTQEIDAGVAHTHALCLEGVDAERVRALEAYLD